METVTLNNGVQIPMVGFGTYRSTEKNGWHVVLDAIEAGYRLIDTAWNYGTEPDVGRALAECGLPRSEFFISSKISRNHLGYDNCKRSLDESLTRLGTDYLDLYLIHWPRPSFGRPDWDDWARLDRETWKAMEEFYRQGCIRAIGVSNFFPEHMENLLVTAEVVPAVNQLELHPGYMQFPVLEYCLELGIQPEAYSPLGRARMLAHPTLVEIAGHYGITTAHLCLAYLLQKGIIVLPKSQSRARMEQNLNPFGVTISKEDAAVIDAMPLAGYSGEHPNRETVPSQTW